MAPSAGPGFPRCWKQRPLFLRALRVLAATASPTFVCLPPPPPALQGTEKAPRSAWRPAEGAAPPPHPFPHEARTPTQKASGRPPRTHRQFAVLIAVAPLPPPIACAHPPPSPFLYAFDAPRSWRPCASPQFGCQSLWAASGARGGGFALLGCGMGAPAHLHPAPRRVRQGRPPCLCDPLWPPSPRLENLGHPNQFPYGETAPVGEAKGPHSGQTTPGGGGAKRPRRRGVAGVHRRPRGSFPPAVLAGGGGA